MINPWKTITNTKGYYSISNRGDVRSNRKGVILKGSKNSSGYVLFRLSVDGCCTSVYGHRLVAFAFLDLESNPHLEVDHINGVKTDNRQDNLRLISHKQNNRSSARSFGTSHYRGVHLDSKTGRWIVKITEDSRSKYIATYDSEDMAAMRWNVEATKRGYGPEALNVF